MDKALILAQELRSLKERVSAIVAIPVPLDGLQGAKGAIGASGKQGEAGAKGSNGKDGKDGKNGTDGEQGVSITSAEVDFDGTLSFQLSNGSSIKTTTEVVGAQGPRGVPGATGDSSSGLSSGTVQLDFGAGNKTAITTVTGITAALTTSRAIATMRLEATASHSVDEMQIDPIRVLIKNLVPGVGFTVYGEMDNALANGLYKADWFISNV